MTFFKICYEQGFVYIFAYDSVSDIGWKIGAQKGYLRCLREKVKIVLKNLYKHCFSSEELISKTMQTN